MNSYLGNSGIHHQVIYDRKHDHFDAINSAMSDQNTRCANIIKMMQQNRHNFNVIKSNDQVAAKGGLNRENESKNTHRYITKLIKMVSLKVGNQ